MKEGIILVPPIETNRGIYEKKFSRKEDQTDHLKCIQKICEEQQIEVFPKDGFCYHWCIALAMQGCMVYEVSNPTIFYIPLNVDSRQMSLFQKKKKEWQRIKVGAFLLEEKEDSSMEIRSLMGNNSKQTLELIEEEMEERFFRSKEKEVGGEACTKKLEYTKKRFN